MPDETLKQIMEHDIEVEAKIIINTSLGGKTKLLLMRNIKGEMDFLVRHFKISREEKADKQIKAKVTKIVEEYINVKKNSVLGIELIQKNKGNLKKFVMDCLVNVKNDKYNHDKGHGFMTLEEITRKPFKKSMSLINTLVYFSENK